MIKKQNTHTHRCYILANLLQLKRKMETLKFKRQSSVDAASAAAAEETTYFAPKFLQAALLFLMCQKSCHTLSLLLFSPRGHLRKTFQNGKSSDAHDCRQPRF